MFTLLAYAICFYLMLGLYVATIGPAGQQIWADFRKHSQGTPSDLAKLGVTQIAPAPLWKCFLLAALSTIAAMILWPGFWNQMFGVAATRIPTIPAAWLNQRTTVVEAEAAHMVRLEKLGPDPIAFGFQNGQWREVLALLQPGDELWNYSSPSETWQNLAGRAGIAVVRDGKVVATLMTLMN